MLTTGLQRISYPNTEINPIEHISYRSYSVIICLIHAGVGDVQIFEIVGKSSSGDIQMSLLGY